LQGKEMSKEYIAVCTECNAHSDVCKEDESIIEPKLTAISHKEWCLSRARGRTFIAWREVPPEQLSSE
jgi:hypothetical protein